MRQLGRESHARLLMTRAAVEVTTLASKFEIPGSVEIKEGLGGLPKVVLINSSDWKAEVYLFGGLVASWTQPKGDEVLYVRPDAVFDKSKPISGGIPHCFPQFGPGAMQQHGFARNLDWAIASTSADPQPDEKDPSVELVLTENDYTLAMWPYPFKAVYTVTLHGDRLLTHFAVHNTGTQAFEFTAALHTYIEVLHISKATVGGLQGLEYLDKAQNANDPPVKKETRKLVNFEGLVDSVYLNAPEHVELDVGTGAAVAIDSSGWKDIVVWNPDQTMPTMYEKFCCVENAVAKTPVKVAPGGVWEGKQEFYIVDL